MKRMVAAGVVAIMLGLMSVVVGTLTMLGIKDAAYITSSWLIVYNVLLGAISFGVGVALIRRRSWSVPAAILISLSHGIVLAIVLVRWSSGEAASESVQAMVMRSSVWIVLSLVTSRAVRHTRRIPDSPGQEDGALVEEVTRNPPAHEDAVAPDTASPVNKVG